MHRHQAPARLVLVVIALMGLGLPAEVAAECADSLIDCVVDPSDNWVALGSLSLVLGSATGGLLAVAWHLVRLAADAKARRDGRPASRAPRAHGASPATRPRASRPPATTLVKRPAPGRTIVGPVWSDGHWVRMVTSERGGQRIEILRPDGWQASDQDVGRLFTDALPATTRRRPDPPRSSR